MVADALIYHPSVSHYLRFAATTGTNADHPSQVVRLLTIVVTAGRDKLLRTIQFLARFYAWYLLRGNTTPASIAPFEAIKKQFGLARKLLSVGKNVEHIRAAATTADNKNMDPVLRYCAVGRQLSYALYLTLDLITYVGNYQIDGCSSKMNDMLSELFT